MPPGPPHLQHDSSRLSQSGLHRDYKAIRLFLSSLGGDGGVVGLGERLGVTLLAVLLSQFRQPLPTNIDPRIID